MNWEYKFDARALRELGKLGKPDQKRVFRYLETRLCTADDPSVFGKPLRHDFAGLWRFRVGDVRLICQLKDKEVVILVVKVGHRKDVYD